MYESEIPTGAEPTAPPPSAPPMEPGAPPPKDDMVPDYGAWPVFRRASVASTVQVWHASRWQLRSGSVETYRQIAS